jgi:hypothetical protein
MIAYKPLWALWERLGQGLCPWTPLEGGPPDLHYLKGLGGHPRLGPGAEPFGLASPH